MDPWHQAWAWEQKVVVVRDEVQTLHEHVGQERHHKDRKAEEGIPELDEESILDWTGLLKP